MVRTPASQAVKALPSAFWPASCSSCWLTMRIPMVQLRRKLEIVAPVKVVFRNRLRSMNGLDCCRSQRMKKKNDATATAARPMTVGLAHPRVWPKMRITVTDSVRHDEQHQAEVVEAALLSGGRLVLRGAHDEEERQGRHRDRDDEDPPPAEGDDHPAPEHGRQAGAAPRADRHMDTARWCAGPSQ